MTVARSVGRTQAMVRLDWSGSATVLCVGCDGSPCIAKAGTSTECAGGLGVSARPRSVRRW